MKSSIMAIARLYRALFLGSILVGGTIFLILAITVAANLLLNINPLIGVALASLITSVSFFAVRGPGVRDAGPGRISVSDPSIKQNNLGGGFISSIRRQFSRFNPHRLDRKGMAVMCLIVVTALLIAGAMLLISRDTAGQKPKPSLNSNDRRGRGKSTANQNINRRRSDKPNDKVTNPLGER